MGADPAALRGPISGVIALSTAAMAQTVVPRGPFLAQVRPNDRELVILILLTACVVS